MNETIRALQREHDEKYQKADALLSKADPTDAERAEGATLITDLKGIKNRLEKEFKLLDMRGELDGIKKDRESVNPADRAAKSMIWAGKVGTDGGWLGMKNAGRVLFDSYGSLIEDIGPGTMGQKRWDAIQTPEYNSAFTTWLRSKGERASLDGMRLKTLQEGLDDQGGVTVPADMLMRIIAREPAPTDLASLVTNITTGRDRVVMPRTQYSADNLYVTAFRAAWTGEIPTGSSQLAVNDANLLGNIEVPVYTAMLSARVTNDMVEDSAFPIQAWVENQLRITVDLLRENMILNGTGKGQPTGLLVNPGGAFQPASILSSGAGTFSGDDLINVAYTLPPQYDKDARYVFNKTNVQNFISKLKDGNGRYLFGMGYQDSGLATARPKELVGYPFTISSFMPNIGAANYPVLFGDLKGYYMVNRLGLTVQILREVAAELNQFIIVCRIRFGGQTVEPWRLYALKSNNA
ncbi:MAG TPA: phage major capsid protein [Gemmatimonadales bacterium]|nr:phage major capsid protein [Gemmatimonadales bacterium]